MTGVDVMARVASFMRAFAGVPIRVFVGWELDCTPVPEGECTDLGLAPPPLGYVLVAIKPLAPEGLLPSTYRYLQLDRVVMVTPLTAPTPVAKNVPRHPLYGDPLPQ